MTTRRQFIKRSAGAVAVGAIMPGIFFTEARGQSPGSGGPARRRKLVVIQFAGGNDGLNTVIPYTDLRYYALRPTLGIREAELIDARNRSMILSDHFGLHPALTEIKDLWDENKVAIILGVGYPNATLSHFLSMDIWHTADLTGLAGKGWLGKYADLALVGQQGLPAMAVSGELPRSFYASKVVIPNVFNFQLYNFLTDPAYPGDHVNQLNAFNTAASRSFSGDSFIGKITNTAFEAVTGAQRLQTAIATYEPGATYNPANPMAIAMQMLAQVITTMPEGNLFYVVLGGFDSHADQVAHPNGVANKLGGVHAALLRYFSEAVKSFYTDLTEHGIADDVLMMQWSEFGRRPGENASFGTDHGTVSSMMIIGNPVRGGLYGIQPSLATSELDLAGNPKFTVDFRAVYATILNRWLGANAHEVLGATYEDIGFLG